MWHWDHSDLVSKLHEEELGNTNLAAMNNRERLICYLETVERRRSYLAARERGRALHLDLLELDGTDLRKQPLEERKAALKTLLRRAKPSV